ncbi:MAG: PepSY domain-containing protein [Acidobacteria bacterium]|nr:PepSY domain-containing protein [Acidobacteriota bacterium]
MAAGFAPPTPAFRFVLAIVVAVAIAVVLPVSSAFAGPSPLLIDDGGKKKDKKKDKDKDERDESKDDDDDSEESSHHKKSKSDDDDDSDDKDGDSDEKDGDSDDKDGAKNGSGEVLARNDEAMRGSVDDAVQSADPASKAEPVAPVTAAPATAAGSLLATAPYVSMSDAIAKARKAGGTGDVLQIDLEYDAFREIATCDVTFSSGTEYEMNAETGEILGEKQKDPRKLALLTPLATDSKSLKTFTDIIGQVSKATGNAVLEIEFKHPKGQPGVIFEVVTADGATTHFDAATGNPAPGA